MEDDTDELRLQFSEAAASLQDAFTDLGHKAVEWYSPSDMSESMEKCNALFNEYSLLYERFMNCKSFEDILESGYYFDETFDRFKKDCLKEAGLSGHPLADDMFSLSVNLAEGDALKTFTQLKKLAQTLEEN